MNVTEENLLCDKCHKWRNPSGESQRICQLCITLYKKCGKCHEWNKPSIENRQICKICINIINMYEKCNECYELKRRTEGSKFYGVLHGFESDWTKPSTDNMWFCQICIENRCDERYETYHHYCEKCYIRGKPFVDVENQRICKDCFKNCKKCYECHKWDKPSEEDQRICQFCIKECKKCDECHGWKRDPQICRLCKKCNECHGWRRNPQICRFCNNKVIDNFIKYTQINCGNQTVKMEFVPYSQFKSVESIAEGGFSEVYKAIWIDGPIENLKRKGSMEVALKKLKNSKNISSKELDEV